MKLFSVKAIASQLQVSNLTVYRWVKSGTIPHIRIGKGSIRFEEETIKEWISNKQIPVYNSLNCDYEN
jgi:excisionase family DNA binding protein